jgi:hypothetical protein
MPALPNPKHELFAQGLASGLSQAKAYVQAGYKPDDAHAARLAGDGRIKGRVAELRGQVLAARAKQQRQTEITTRQHFVVSVNAIAEELQAAYDMAVQLEMPNAMATASLGKAKLFGLFPQASSGFRQIGGRKGRELGPIERRAIVAGMSDDELGQAIMGRLKDGELRRLIALIDRMRQEYEALSPEEREQIEREADEEDEPEPIKPAPAPVKAPPPVKAAQPPRLPPDDPLIREPAFAKPETQPPVQPLERPAARPQRRVLN